MSTEKANSAWEKAVVLVTNNKKAVLGVAVVAVLISAACFFNPALCASLLFKSKTILMAGGHKAIEFSNGIVDAVKGGPAKLVNFIKNFGSKVGSKVEAVSDKVAKVQTKISKSKAAKVGTAGLMGYKRANQAKKVYDVGQKQMKNAFGNDETSGKWGEELHECENGKKIKFAKLIHPPNVDGKEACKKKIKEKGENAKCLYTELGWYGEWEDGKCHYAKTVAPVARRKSRRKSRKKSRRKSRKKSRGKVASRNSRRKSRKKSRRKSRKKSRKKPRGKVASRKSKAKRRKSIKRRKRTLKKYPSRFFDK